MRRRLSFANDLKKPSMTSKLVSIEEEDVDQKGIPVLLELLLSYTVHIEELGSRLRPPSRHVLQGPVAEDDERRHVSFVCQLLPQRAQPLEQAIAADRLGPL